MKLTLEQKCKIIDLFNEGKTQEETEALTGIPKEDVSRVLQEVGIVERIDTWSGEKSEVGTGKREKITINPIITDDDE